MAEHEDFMMRPVRQHLCLYESLVNGTLDLLDVAIMNESLDVEEINQGIARDWTKKHAT